MLTARRRLENWPMTMFLPNFTRIRGMRDTIGTKDMRGMIGDPKEQIGMRGMLGKVEVIRTSTKEGIEIDSIGSGTVTEKETAARIDTETVTSVLSPTPIISQPPLPTTPTLTLRAPTSQATVS